MIQTLKNMDGIHSARKKLKELGLDYSQGSRIWFWSLLYNLRYRFQSKPPIPDHTKSWDVYHGLEIIKSEVSNKDASILDMGCFNSEILLALYGSGYKNIYGCDLNAHCKWMPFWHKIHYGVCDLTETIYKKEQFSAVTCFSVIEHGVPLEKFVPEVNRVLKPGGLLVLTTDFDSTGQEHLISEEFRAFNQTWMIFDKESLQKLIEDFKSYGFELLNPNKQDFDHKECPIHWNDQDYTFTMLAFKKVEK